MLPPFLKPNPMPRFIEVVERDQLFKKAFDFYKNDPRANFLAQSCVAYAREHVGQIDPEDCERGAHDTALYAALLVLTRVYAEDSEIATLRAERDHYRRIAEDVLLLSPMRQLVRDSDTQPEAGDAHQGSARE